MISTAPRGKDHSRTLFRRLRVTAPVAGSGASLRAARRGPGGVGRPLRLFAQLPLLARLPARGRDSLQVQGTHGKGCALLAALVWGEEGEGLSPLSTKVKAKPRSRSLPAAVRRSRGSARRGAAGGDVV